MHHAPAADGPYPASIDVTLREQSPGASGHASGLPTPKLKADPALA
ncbi:MAG: hypothetical protein ACLPKE_06235 [Streptosporangiaceae bacterium]